MNYYFEQKKCRLCDCENLKTEIHLEPLPIASPNIGFNSNISDNIMAPVDVNQCKECGFLQLSVVINPEFQYRTFLYKTDLSLGLRQHFDNLMDKLQEFGAIKENYSVFDVGSNDGSLLELAKNRKCKVLGIDPAIETAKEATAKGIPTYGDFFTEEKSREIQNKHGKFDVIISNNTIANIDNLKDVFNGFRNLLKDDGLVVIETQYALDVLQKKLVDVIYHEHISYFLVEPMKIFLDKMGFELIHAECISPKGGSIRFIAQLKGASRHVDPCVSKLIENEHACGLYNSKIFNDFKEYVEETGKNLRGLLSKSKEENGKAFAYGSSVGCSALIHYFSLHNIIDFIFDDFPLGDSIVVKNNKIPVLKGQDLKSYPASEIVVLAWRYLDSICKKQNEYINKGGKFIPAIQNHN